MAGRCRNRAPWRPRTGIGSARRRSTARAGWYHYGYRFYEPHLQRWVNRDPLGERGGMNLYTFVVNSPTDLVDSWGLEGTGTPVPFPPRDPTLLHPPPKPGYPKAEPITKPRMKGKQATFCVLVYAGALRDQLKHADDDYSDCLEACSGLNPVEINACVNNCLTIHQIDACALGGCFVRDSLLSLLGPSRWNKDWFNKPWRR